MQLSILMAAMLLAGPGQPLAPLELGDPVPEGAKPIGSSLMVSPAQIWPEHQWTKDGIVYSLAADRQGRVQYFATSSIVAETPGGFRVGQRLEKVLETPNLEVTRWPGWGYVLQLPSGWKAALFLDGEFLDRKPRETDQTDILFKGTLAGYGS